MMGRLVSGALGLILGIVALQPAPAFAQTRYQCSGGVPVLVNYGGRHAELRFLGITYFLPQVPLAQGSRYSDGRFTWTVSRDQVGTLTHDGNVIARECRTGATSQPGGTTTAYTCAGGGTVTATYSGSTATVVFQGNTYRLVQVPLAEGSRYTDGQFTWTIGRDEVGTLTRFRALVARECRKEAGQPREPER